MNYIRQLFPKSHMRLPAAALTVVVGLAFACSESPTEATPDGLGASFAKGGNKGGNTNDCGFTLSASPFAMTTATLCGVTTALHM